MKILGLIVINLLILISCKKEYTPIPVATVSQQLLLNLPNYISLTNTHGYCYIKNTNNDGVKGLIVYNIGGEFVAYDLCCSYLPTTGTIQIVSPGFTTAQCINCGSVFSLLDGQVIKGPASYPLRAYNVSVTTDVNGSPISLYISN